MAMPEMLATPAAAEVPEQAKALNSEADVKENLKSFTDSLHTKASLVTSWLNQLDTQSSDKSKEQLVCQSPFSCFGIWMFWLAAGSRTDAKIS